MAFCDLLGDRALPGWRGGASVEEAPALASEPTGIIDSFACPIQKQPAKMDKPKIQIRRSSDFRLTAMD
jgi:hypothetical protein